MAVWVKNHSILQKTQRRRLVLQASGIKQNIVFSVGRGSQTTSALIIFTFSVIYQFSECHLITKTFFVSDSKVTNMREKLSYPFRQFIFFLYLWFSTTELNI